MTSKTTQEDGKWLVAGTMSGTSLDGLDIALCEFELREAKFSYRFLAGETVQYDASLRSELAAAHALPAQEWFYLHARYGQFIGEAVREFLRSNRLAAQLISSHGHTVFHQPSRGISVQVGSGAHIAAAAGIETVCDLRALDVALGGQGAPLVPLGDALLFSDHDACLNIGGIANISFEKNGIRRAYDICFANMLLNELAARGGKLYDDNGSLARSGVVQHEVLTKLLQDENGRGGPGRSLAREGVSSLMGRLNGATLADLLATATELVAQQIAGALNAERISSVLLTGGGAYNGYLVERISAQCSAKVDVPAAEIVEFKEAIIFGLLGLMRKIGFPNTLKSVTGARCDSVGGAIYLPPT